MNPETSKPKAEKASEAAKLDVTSAAAAEAEVRAAAKSLQAQVTAAAMEVATTLAVDGTAGNPVNGKEAWSAVAA